MRAAYGESLRRFFVEQTNPIELIDFAGQKIFDATVDTNILLTKKEPYAKLTKSTIVKEDCLGDLSVYIKQHATACKFEGGESWTVLSDIEQRIKAKIEAIGVPLKDWDIKINYGIKTGCNEAFIIDGATKDRLIAEDPKSAEIIRPILRGRDIKRYSYEFADKWVIATFPSRNYDIEDYPAVKNWLRSAVWSTEIPDGYGQLKLEQTGETHIVEDIKFNARKKTGNKWFETQDQIRYWDDFSKQKIAWGNLCLHSQFAIVEADVFINAPAPLITPASPYILAVLNSKIGDWYIRQLGVTRSGGYFEYKPMFIEKLPIPVVDAKTVNHIVRLVDEAKEDELNNQIALIYGFSDVEMSFISSSENPK
jgi:hypothetical protein